MMGWRKMMVGAAPEPCIGYLWNPLELFELPPGVTGNCHLYKSVDAGVLAELDAFPAAAATAWDFYVYECGGESWRVMGELMRLCWGALAVAPPLDCCFTTSEWSECSASCGDGEQTRTNTIERPAYNDGPLHPPLRDHLILKVLINHRLGLPGGRGERGLQPHGLPRPRRLRHGVEPMEPVRG